jgi:hypothetical protein
LAALLHFQFQQAARFFLIDRPEPYPLVKYISLPLDNSESLQGQIDNRASCSVTHCAVFAYSADRKAIELYRDPKN